MSVYKIKYGIKEAESIPVNSNLTGIELQRCDQVKVKTLYFKGNKLHISHISAFSFKSARAHK